MHIRHPKTRSSLTYELACVVQWLVRVKKLTQRETAALLGFGEGTIGRVMRRELFPDAYPLSPQRLFRR